MKWAHCAVLLFLALIGPASAAEDLETAITQISATLADALSSGEFEKLAVIEFTNLNGYESALDVFVAEEMVTQFITAKPGVFDIVERHQLAKVLEEQKLSSSSLFDAETIARVGKILGIEAIVTGTIADLGDEIKINARVISTDTAKVFAAASAKCPKKGIVDTLMRQAAAPSRVDTSRGARNIQASDVFFQNSFMRLTVKGLSVSKNKRKAVLTLHLENLGSPDLYLAIDCPFMGCNPVRLASDAGKSLTARCQGGVAGLACILSWGTTDDVNKYTLIAGKSRTTIVIEFEAYEDIQGQVFSTSLNLLRFNSGKAQRVSAGIANIALN